MADDTTNAENTEVTLHIYDMTTSSAQPVNGILQVVGTGTFHGGVQVYDAEWSYGYTDHGSGVFSSKPRRCLAFSFRMSVFLGYTIMSRVAVKNIIERLEMTWQGHQYDVLNRNCVSFCDLFCTLLNVEFVPAGYFGCPLEAIVHGKHPFSEHGTRRASKQSSESRGESKQKFNSNPSVAEDTPKRPGEVTLHIYDVSKNANVHQVNRILQVVGTGAFHGGVEVYDAEWSYGYTDHGSGVFSSKPKQCSLHTYRKSVHMGFTIMSRELVKNVIGGLEWTWQGDQYDVLSRNCVTFCEEFCKVLGVGEVPAWVRSLSGAGATVRGSLSKFKLGGVDAQLNKAALSVQRIWRGHAHRKRLWHSVGPLVENYKDKAVAAKAAAARFAAQAALNAAENAHAAQVKAATCVQKLWRRKTQSQRQLPLNVHATPRSVDMTTPRDNGCNDAATCFVNHSPLCCEVNLCAKKVDEERVGPRVSLKLDGHPVGGSYLACSRGDCIVM